MAKKHMSFVDMVIGYNDAWNWINEKFYQYEEEWFEEWAIKHVEIKEMDSGGYRVGFVMEGQQTELFGATEDA